MDVKASYRYARISPFKARDVAREVTGLPVSAALDILQFTPKKAAFLIGKTLKSAIANAENNHDLASDDLIVKSATVNEGPVFKRWKPRARGGAAPIHKRTAHIDVILTTDGGEIEVSRSERKAGKKVKTAGSAPAAPAPEGARTDEVLGVVYDSAPSEVDDLKKISGVGPKLEETLNEHGIYRYEQIANWNDAQIAEFDELLSFKDRIARDEWVKQATELAAG